MRFVLKSFDQLTTSELYRILQIRAEVFVVEQDCVYQDVDGKDMKGHHVLGYANGRIEAYTRILPPGISYENHASIGRVLTTEGNRGSGAGKQLMHQSIKYCKELYPDNDIKISAQTYLLSFYNDLGFKEWGESYLEDGIPHIAMVFSNPSGKAE
ncbi:GNAT family N-acetyltransferase [Portibacter marinus]|uniref:GNAT family N-acetyltransferase n=1 Tax=Portibacter marinus TaxID=2898660 RepID=UPI001F316982|nr:GNAT family N-acetyltransferase [Portibacter marinus]